MSVNTILADNGRTYLIPNGIAEENFLSIMRELVDFTKTKGLTVRQAQALFECCKDYALDSNL